ncbi:MAG: family 43 glycosylhydrolase [Actinomycetota bacterium]|nr:family 43 glycosylhydrolase [Actinomycetota bacterium]
MIISATVTAVSLILATRTAATSLAVAVEPPPLTDLSRPGLAVAPAQGIDLPDPMMVSTPGRYYMYVSTAFGDPRHLNVPAESGVPGRWSAPFDAMPVLPDWAFPTLKGGRTWDPYVQKFGRTWLMYFSSLVRTYQPQVHCLGVARASSPDGPFVAVGNGPMVCQRDQGGDIDVQPFYDARGPGGSAHPWYLVWKSDDNNLHPPRPTEVWVAPLANDGLSLTGPARVVFRADQPWEKPVMEAPQMVLSPDGQVWLFFSGGRGFYTSTYAMGAAVCTGPMGTCHTVGQGPLISSNAQGQAPGEETVFIAPDRSYWLLYNPWHTGDGYALFRPAEAVRIGWTARGPYVGRPGTFPPPPPARERAPRLG